MLAEILRSDGRQIHKLDGLMLPAEFGTHLHVQGERGIDVLLDEGLLDLDVLELGGESGVTAVVTPVGIEDAEFGLVGVASLGSEIIDHFLEVVSIHGEAHLLAEAFLVCDFTESFQKFHRNDIGMLEVGEFGKILLP